MSEHPYWPRVFVERAENGWIVRKAFPPRIDNGLVSVDSGHEEPYVFNSWVECAEFIGEVTVPARAEVPLLTDSVKIDSPPNFTGVKGQGFGPP